jgi:hypothetical protein
MCAYNSRLIKFNIFKCIFIDKPSIFAEDCAIISKKESVSSRDVDNLDNVP